MTEQQRAEAIERLGTAYRAVVTLIPAVGALDDPQALAYADIAQSVLTRLSKHLEAQSGARGGEETP